MSADSNGRTWDWLDDDADIVVKAQPAVAIYAGPAGVVIRRQGDWNDDDDGVVWFGVDQAHAVAKAILEAADLDATALAPEPAQDATKPMACTGAERQKRYRQRKKKEPALFDGEGSDVTRDVTRDESAA